MISNFVSEHVLSSEMDPLLEALFQYIDQLFLPETPYMTGRPPIPKKSLLKCFFLKTYFSIDSLRHLVDTLDRFGYFRRIWNSKRFHIYLRFHVQVSGFKNKDFPFLTPNFSKI
jgi:hypothetical protein